MNNHAPTNTRIQRAIAGRRIAGFTAAAVGGAGFMAVLAWSGIVAFQRQAEPVPLAATDHAIERTSTDRSTLGSRPAPSFEVIAPAPASYEVISADRPADRPADRAAAPAIATPATTPGVKLDRAGNVIIVNGKPWTGETFDYRPIRQAYTRTMKTTAYSPDEKSCGKWADGITASGKSVWMNGGRLVAADRAIPYGTILTIPGYNNEQPVQVWDRGGKIKGNRLDLLYPTHQIALQWGVQDLPVVFWEYVETD